MSTLTFNARQYFEADYFRSASDLFLAFKKNEKRLRKHVVLFIDEYNILYIASDRNLFLETLHGIKNTREMFAFWSAVAIGLLAFCVWNPFNVKNPYHNPNYKWRVCIKFCWSGGHRRYLRMDKRVWSWLEIYVLSSCHVCAHIRDLKNLTTILLFNRHAAFACLCKKTDYNN